MKTSAVGKFTLVHLKPTSEFKSFSATKELAGLSQLDLTPKLQNLPLISVVCDPGSTPCWLPSIFLADIALRGKSVMGDSVRTYGEALIAWFNFLAQRSALGDEVTEMLLASFRAFLFHGKSSNGEPFSTATANTRVTVVCGFYLWCQQHSLHRTPLGELLLEWERDKKKRIANQEYCVGSRHPFAATRISRLPTSLSHEAINALFNVASMPFKLMFRWAIVTGLRRFEVANLMRQQLPDALQLASSSEEFARIEIRRKGMKVSPIFVPMHLVEETNWYVLVDRPTAQINHEHYVFLNASGRGVSRHSLSTEFRKCADRVGSKATLHHLRHTFAVHVLGYLERIESNGNPMNSLKILQVLMGHSSISSTEIYLRSAEVSSAHVMDALGYLYGATL